MEVLEIRESGSQKIAYILWEDSPQSSPPPTAISYLHNFSVEIETIAFGQKCQNSVLKK